MLFVNVFLCSLPCTSGQNYLPRHRLVQLIVKIGKSPPFDNVFFCESFRCKKFKINKLNQCGRFFDPILGHKLAGQGGQMECFAA